jgi:hypothetical protein
MQWDRRAGNGTIVLASLEQMVLKAAQRYKTVARLPILESCWQRHYSTINGGRSVQVRSKFVDVQCTDRLRVSKQTATTGYQATLPGRRIATACQGEAGNTAKGLFPTR